MKVIRALGCSLATCVLATSLACLRLWIAPAAVGPVRVSNGYLAVGFDRRAGEWLELTDLASKLDFAGAPNSSATLWQVSFSTNTVLTKPLTPMQAGSFRFDKTGARAAELVWEKFGLPQAPNLRVRASVQLIKNEAKSRWHISIENLGALRPAEVRFPVLADLTRQDNERLAVPAWMGQLTTQPRTILEGTKGRGRSLAFDYPSHASMQCLAWYRDGGPGFYLSCDDTKAFRKSFVFAGDGKGRASCWVAHLPENTATQAQVYVLPYRVVIGTFSGDWITAAEIYRDWATKQAWARESRLRRNAVPPWARQTALWVWNRGRSPNVTQPALALQKELGLPVSVFWHWWHGCSYDTGFPEYLPPREGDAAFRAALASAHAQNVHAIVYMNQRLWGMTTKSWEAEGAERFAVKAANGKVRPEVYNTFTRAPCASMCLHTDFWRNKYAGLAEAAVTQLGVDGIYMDQACTSLACYDPTHGHPLGGGTYWMNGFRRLAADIRRRCAGRTVTLGGEGVGESWLPHLDLMLSLQVSRERYAAPDRWEPIPFFQAVYHPFVVQYGSYSSLTMPPYDELWPAEFAPKQPLQLLDRRFSRQFYLEQARAFVWGQQPTLANFMPTHLTDRPDEMAYVFQLARVRQRALKFLLHGAFLRPPVLDVPDETIAISRLSIYAGQKGSLTAFTKRVPLALSGAWHAPDGSLGIALASIADRPLDVELNLDRGLYQRSSNSRVWRIDESGRKLIGRLASGQTALSVPLAARAACVIEIASE